MFFAGLRLGRMLMPWMPSGGSAGLMQDVGLAASIGSATGMFVATDLSFTVAQSDAFYKLTSPVFGVLETDTALLGCVKAGSSTFAGFGALNLLQSAVLPRGACWMDGNNPYASAEQ